DPRDDLIPVSLGGLAGWRINDTLLNAALRGQDPERVAAFMRITGGLPPGRLGEKAFEECLSFLDSIEQRAHECHVTVSPGVREQVDADTPWGRLLGDVRGVQGHRQVVFTPSRLKPKDLLKAWIRLAALT